MRWIHLSSVALAVMLALSSGFTATASAQGADKVTICHNGNTITVSENALDAHLGHGDTRGPCEDDAITDPEPDPDTEPEPEDDALETVEVTGVVVYFDPVMGIVRLQDGTIVILYDQPDFPIQSGMMVLVRGIEQIDGSILALLITPDVGLGETELSYLPVQVEVTGEVTGYNPEYGTFRLNGIRVIPVIPVSMTIENGMLLSVNGELLPDGRVLVLLMAEYEVIDPEGDPELPEAGLVTICHVPPGNNDYAHTITVGAPAVSAHMAHGDYLGPCDENAGELDEDVQVIRSVCDGPCDPVLIVLADEFDSQYSDLAELREQGYGIGEIARLYVLGELAQVEVTELQTLRAQGLGWGEILARYPDVSRSAFVERANLGDGRRN